MLTLIHVLHTNENDNEEHQQGILPRYRPLSLDQTHLQVLKQYIKVMGDI